MSRIVDDEGNLLGRVNVIDAIVVLLFVAIVFAGVSIATAEDRTAEQSTIIVSTAVSPAVYDALGDARAIEGSDVVSIGQPEVVETYQLNQTNDSLTNRTRHRVEFEVVLEPSQSEGLPHFRGERLYVGRTLELDLTTTIVDVEVVAVDWDGDRRD